MVIHRSSNIGGKGLKSSTVGVGPSEWNQLCPAAHEPKPLIPDLGKWRINRSTPLLLLMTLLHRSGNHTMELWSDDPRGAETFGD